MVSGPAAADAIACARRNPNLRVGLHLVLVDGAPTLPAARIPGLIDHSGRLRSDMARLGTAIALKRRLRLQVAAEIEAQFEAFRATGLALDHVNGHHHYQVHPAVGNEVLAIGRRFGMRALRVPYEPPRLLDAIEPGVRHRRDWVIAPWVARLRRRTRREGVAFPRHVFGIAWSGAMTEVRMAAVIRGLPEGLNEMYVHPATSDHFAGAAPGSRSTEELAALVSPSLRALLRECAVTTGGFADLANR
jgi:hopanoid biosynthesis associated protein HpnK